MLANTNTQTISKLGVELLYHVAVFMNFDPANLDVDETSKVVCETKRLVIDTEEGRGPTIAHLSDALENYVACKRCMLDALECSITIEGCDYRADDVQIDHELLASV